MKLVTGSSGFIGSNIEADLKWDRSTCDLTDYNRVLELFDQHPIKTVVHCAVLDMDLLLKWVKIIQVILRTISYVI